MQSRKFFSVGFVSVLVVLAAVSAVGFAGTGLGPNTLAQSNTGDEANDSRANATAIETNQQGFSEGLLRHTYNETTDTVTEEDVDFYEFDASAGQAINVYLRSGFPTVEATLYGPSGDILGNITSGAAATTLGGVANENGTYYLRIRGDQPVRAGESGTYQFGVDLTDRDSFEPNDDRSAATSIESGEHVNGTIMKGDVDFFAVEADAGESINATTALRDTNVLNQGNVAIDILNSNGERLNEVANDTLYPYQGDNVTNQDGAKGSGEVSQETVNATVEDAGTYYVRVTESSEDNDLTDIGGLVKYDMGVTTSGADNPTTEEPTTTERTTEDTTTEDTQQSNGSGGSDESTAYYQVDFVIGEPIENLRGPEGTYTNDQLIRFAHGSTDEPVTRRSDGEFITDGAMAERIESQDIEVANGTATTTFTVAEGESVTLTLASYEKVGPGWSPQTESEQVFVDSETRTFESGTHTLTVDLPDEDLTGDSDDADAE